MTLTNLTIAEAARRLRAGETSSVELTNAVLERIAATEPAIHAYVLVLEQQALAAAEQADAEPRAGKDRGPLHGIPIAVKDIFDIQGLPTRCGSEVRCDVPAATTDAAVVTRLREAGAVIVGKTVTHEFAAGVISPPARNPWDPTRIPGGSSGGSGASVAAGSSFAALGSDTAGSIRIPASLNGVVGLKPTYGRVSRVGVFPLSWSLDTVGPLARTVEDAQLVFAAIRDDGDDIPALADAEGLAGVRLGVPRSYFYGRLQPDVAAAIEQAIGTFADLGAEIVEVDWAEAEAAAAAGFVICRPELAAVHEQTLRETPERFGPLLRSRLEAFSLVPGREYLRARRARTILRRSIADLYRRHDLAALIVPATAATAPRADALTVPYADGEEPVHAALTRCTMPFNTTGQPALSMPCGFDRDGLPTGMQIVGRPYEEARLCGIGRAFERATAAEGRWPALTLTPNPSPIGMGEGSLTSR
jgi:aspartyl-tRNA(Asn)/glutamyl-tRNA(Gln) amidotransferase subunit A